MSISRVIVLSIMFFSLQITQICAQDTIKSSFVRLFSCFGFCSNLKGRDGTLLEDDEGSDEGNDEGNDGNSESHEKFYKGPASEDEEKRDKPDLKLVILRIKQDKTKSDSPTTEVAALVQKVSPTENKVIVLKELRTIQSIDSPDQSEPPSPDQSEPPSPDKKELSSIPEDSEWVFK